ncbi:hypothetical protein ACTNA4_10835 [Bariatricus sp. HCP28S3_A7]|uniref:hypothetical protein n=1 Tax=Bariatricus sp. HCP28S3_A7 TaxID=3438894 RepID=UPI003F892C6F
MTEIYTVAEAQTDAEKEQEKAAKKKLLREMQKKEEVSELPDQPETIDMKDGIYTIEVELEGGTGKAGITSPAEMTVKDGTACARIQWSSRYYDYMIVNDEKYLPVNEEGNSVFEIPVYVYDRKMEVIADTTAMSVPHEITYALTFKKETIEKAENTSPFSGIVVAAAAIAAAVFFVVRKKRRC